MIEEKISVSEHYGGVYAPKNNENFLVICVMCLYFMTLSDISFTKIQKTRSLVAKNLLLKGRLVFFPQKTIEENNETEKENIVLL